MHKTRQCTRKFLILVCLLSINMSVLAWQPDKIARAHERYPAPHLAQIVAQTSASPKRSFSLHPISAQALPEVVPLQGQICPADVNADGQVSGPDLSILVSQWGPCPGCRTDLNSDGIVGGADLSILGSAWGTCQLFPAPAEGTTGANGIATLPNATVEVVDAVTATPIGGIDVAILESEPVSFVIAQDPTGKYEPKFVVAAATTQDMAGPANIIGTITVKLTEVGREIQIWREETSIDDIRNALNDNWFIHYRGTVTKEQLDTASLVASVAVFIIPIPGVRAVQAGLLLFKGGSWAAGLAGIPNTYQFDIWEINALLRSVVVLIPAGAPLRIEFLTPSTDFFESPTRLFNVTGIVAGDPNLASANLLHNGDTIPMTLSAAKGFSQAISLSSGTNLLRVVADPTLINKPLLGLILGKTSATTHVIFRGSTATALKAVLSWETTGTDLDLHVWDSRGNHTFFANLSGIPGSSLDIDDRCGPGIETFVLQPVTVGVTYSIGVEYYAANGRGATPYTLRIFDDLNPSTVPSTFTGTLNNTGDHQLVTSFPLGSPQVGGSWQTQPLDNSFCGSQQTVEGAVPKK
jgi:uncharacterized protein YfaP (DUF2135 family)